MLLNPIENSAYKNWLGVWKQSNPRLTQLFGENPQMYKPFNLNGHNGIDWGIPVGTPIYAPCDGKVKTSDSGTGGYGLHIKIRSRHGAREIVLGHLSSIKVTDGQMVNMGECIGLSGNTGFSTGPHLHMGLRFLEPNSKDIYQWTVRDYDNGYYGYVDQILSLITFKGGYDGDGNRKSNI